MLFGTAKRVITPPVPVRLAGYASRTTTYESVKEDIFLRIHIHRTTEAQLIFIYGDLIWWNTEFVDRARLRLKEVLGLASDTIFFIASHNHSGPPTGNTFIPQLESSDSVYEEFLLEEIALGVNEALEHLDEVTVWRFEGSSSINVYRRMKTGNGIVMEPNFEVPADNTLTLLGFLGAGGEMKGIVVHYACHANISGENTIQPDYPGITLRLLDEAYPASVSMFWQGCTGDLRPRNVLGNHFETGNYEKSKEFAMDFYKDCQKTLAKSGRKLTEQPCIRIVEVMLPLENRFSDEEVRQCLASEDSIQREWAQKVLQKGNQDGEVLRMKYLRYGDGLTVYFFNAEISQHYAIFAREKNIAALCTAYTDGMIGYLCTKEQIAEGGYEPIGSARYFALGGTYSPEIEHIIKAKMKEIDE